MSPDTAPGFDVVVPTTGRDSLRVLLGALAEGAGALPERVILVDDRPAEARRGLPGLPVASPLSDRLLRLRGPARGPAAARNAGWRAARAEWVAFLDDDVVPAPDWRPRLAADLAAAGGDVAAVQGRVEVPLPAGRRPTDWERNVKGLETARWATADMAYRRAALADAGGFDERFGRAYREDSDLALRLVRGGGWRIVSGRRRVSHPPRRAGRLVSLRLQAGNADDVLMRALHGRGWRAAAGAPPGRRGRHLAITAAGAISLLALAGRRRTLAAAGGAVWAAGTAELAWARIGPGPRTRDETLLMAATSLAMPSVATAYTAWGLVTLPARLRGGRRPDAGAARPGAGPRSRRAVRGGGRARAPLADEHEVARAPRPEAVLLDRDGTLVVDVPYNGDPRRVQPVPGARRAVERLRAAGIRLAVVSNQSGIARGSLDERRVAAVNRRVEELLGPLGPWLICPHAPDQGCDCRKPRPGLVLRAAELLGVEPARCAVVGDIGADVEAASAAGARGVLVPNDRTRPEEVARAPETAPSLGAAVDMLIGQAA